MRAAKRNMYYTHRLPGTSSNETLNETAHEARENVAVSKTIVLRLHVLMFYTGYF